jgi:hypothetical protein
MEFDAIFAKTPASMDEIRVRVGHALERHRLCRDVQFEVVRIPFTSKGNWTISLRSFARDALWDASDIVADIQEAYHLSATV